MSNYLNLDDLQNFDKDAELEIMSEDESIAFLIECFGYSEDEAKREAKRSSEVLVAAAGLESGREHRGSKTA